MRLPPFNPRIVVFLSIIAISSTVIFVKLLHNVPASVIANYRLLLAVIIMMPFILKKYRHEFGYIRSKDWLFLITAGLSLATHFILFFDSLNYTSITSSVVIIALQPVLGLFIGYLLLKESFSAGSGISMIICTLGIAIIIIGDALFSTRLFGDVLALISLIFVTTYYLAGETIRKKLSLLTYTFIVYGIGSVALLIFNLSTHKALLNYSGQQWLYFICLAVFPTFLGFILLKWSFKWLNTSTVSIGIAMHPVVATIFALIIFREKVTAFQWLGGTVIVFGLFLFIMSTAKKTKVTISHRKE